MRRTNLVVILGMMQVSKKIPFEDPLWLNGIRGMYVLSNLIILGLYVYSGIVIKKKNGLFIHPSIHPRALFSSFFLSLLLRPPPAPAFFSFS